LFVVGIVARSALFAKDWQDVLLKCDLILFGRGLILCQGRCRQAANDQKQTYDRSHRGQLPKLLSSVVKQELTTVEQRPEDILQGLFDIAAFSE
ncbi:hypothetical protein ACWTQZ_26365, partial [Escherichia coli]